LKRYILTGAPGAGKTAIIRALENLGHFVVEEAATDIIALRHAQGEDEPHSRPGFVDDIVALQKQRQIQVASAACDLQFHDRSAVCSYALAAFLGYPPSAILMDEMARIEQEQVYEKEVFFIDNLGFVQPTAARRISFEDCLKFEAMHEEVYRAFGYDCVRIAAGPLADRVEQIRRRVFGGG
jgi:predicted ATPase